MVTLETKTEPIGWLASEPEDRNGDKLQFRLRDCQFAAASSGKA
jgi:hypothetical protein